MRYIVAGTRQEAQDVAFRNGLGASAWCFVDDPEDLRSLEVGSRVTVAGTWNERQDRSRLVYLMRVRDLKVHQDHFVARVVPALGDH